MPTTAHMDNDWNAAYRTIAPMLLTVSNQISAALEEEAQQLSTQRRLAAELRRLRKKRGISLRKMAVALGITAPFLSDLERGNRTWSVNRAKQFIAILKRK